MMSGLTPAEQMLYTTVNLTTFVNGNPSGTGTGFFYHIDLGNDHSSALLITNKHVLKGATAVTALLHVAKGSPEDGPSGEVVSCAIQLGAGGIVDHPDADVDLCAVNISQLVAQAKAAGKPLFFVTLTRENLPSNDDWENFDAIEEVTMVGCPRGIFDEVNNTPIARRGITGTPLSRPYNGKQEFVVDMACFPGSSGSPIFIYDKGGYFDRKQKAHILGGTRFFFVGILFSGPRITNTGQIVLAQSPRVDVATMMHLGHAIRSTRVLDIETRVRDIVAAQSAPSAGA